ncbi:hypothetical protein [Neisseria sp. Ec49-e6-T10]|uniref:hypothetical protein n=1 Tax=Neisseria sp. Ec49-e6-T10 TaxID=3140744 RepID=UPI003EBFF4D9
MKNLSMLCVVCTVVLTGGCANEQVNSSINQKVYEFLVFGGKTPTFSQDQGKINSANNDPYMIVYGKDSCGLTRRMIDQLNHKNIPYVYKSTDIRQYSNEMYNKMRLARLNTSSFMLPVVEVNRYMLVSPDAPKVLQLYTQKNN